MFYFSDNSLFFYAILHVFVLYSHYGCSISNEKLNGRQAVESLGLLGALIFSSNSTFHNNNNNNNNNSQ